MKRFIYTHVLYSVQTCCLPPYYPPLDPLPLQHLPAHKLSFLPFVLYKTNESLPNEAEGRCEGSRQTLLKNNQSETKLCS